MAEVVGGKTKSLPGRIVEIIGWWPALAALVVAGGASFLDANHMMQMPDWAGTPMNIYRSLRDQIIQTSLGKTVAPNLADLAVGGVGLVTMISRKILGFVFSIGGFIVLALIAWFILGKAA